MNNYEIPQLVDDPDAGRTPSRFALLDALAAAQLSRERERAANAASFAAQDARREAKREAQRLRMLRLRRGKGVRPRAELKGYKRK